MIINSDTLQNQFLATANLQLMCQLPYNLYVDTLHHYDIT